MATRRPKVPRADALGGKSTASRPSGAGAGSAGTASGSEGADVIKGEFGATRTAAKSSTPATAAPARAGSSKTSSSKTSTSKTVGAKTPPVKAAEKASDKPGSDAKDERDLDPVPAKAFSGRMLALAVVMIAITIMLAPTVKIFLEKRAEISALEAEIAGKKAEQTELNKQLSRWQDPNYVKQQARDRINMVMPGETGYWVFGGEEAAGTPGGRTGSGSSANPENLPWVDALWESIRRSATD
ncbi:septum formation initiator family protein [Paenarthrobacter nitroguajacolicus]|uniref:Septum formation initiator family protein n=1 Tax=Paenarthrobacter nitroguajacolicus TaxID=211146 RepID=A0A558HBZ9_PAENT|nr:septum formation initiator family protein [Paenarthrobacter nitroguajacolicus]TVU66659.1 septum formation initiator family protein [Paenarthrobacter nitroguajacolicus]